MDGSRFDSLARTLVTVGSRRRALGGVLFAGALGMVGSVVETDAKKKKKPCPPCKKRKKGKCRGGCAAGAVCRENVCVFCASGQVGCRDVCITLATDRANCGKCGAACPAGAICQNGTCRFCEPGTTQCGNVCANLATDATNCGRCGRTCPTGQCLNGACTCGPQSDCPAGCSCYAEAHGGGACGGVATSKPCDNYYCGLGEVCIAGYVLCTTAC
jgi:hypothetical protein